MKLMNLCPILLLAAACHTQANNTEPAPGGISFTDSIQNQLTLTNSQLAYRFQIDTTGLTARYSGKELRDLGNYYVMVLDIEEGSDWLYVVDKKTGIAVDDDVLDISSDANSDNQYSQSAYEIVNDSTIKVLEEVYESETDDTPDYYQRTYIVSHTGKIITNDE